MKLDLTSKSFTSFRVLLFFFAFSCIFYHSIHAEVPHLLNYQGRLTDADSKPVADGSYSVTFRIYDAEAAGNLLWHETQSVITKDGIFNVLLGSVTDLDLPFDKPYWLEIKVGAEVMSPRQRIASVGYALRAKVADSLSGYATIPFYVSGFELEYVDFVHVKVTPGAINVAGSMYTPRDPSTLNVTSGGNWLTGTTDLTDGWAYIYVSAPDGSLIYRFSRNAPIYSDASGGQYRPKRYIKYEANYYRCIGAVGLKGGKIQEFFQCSNWIWWSDPITVKDTVSSTWADLDCSLAVPKISTMVALGVYSHVTGQYDQYVYIRPKGATDWEDNADQLHYRGSQSNTPLGSISRQKIFITDAEQKLEYKTHQVGTLQINVEGYMLNIR